MALLARLVRQDLLAHKAQLVLKVLLDKMVRQVLLARKAKLVQLVL